MNVVIPVQIEAIEDYLLPNIKRSPLYVIEPFAEFCPFCGTRFSDPCDSRKWGEPMQEVP